LYYIDAIDLCQDLTRASWLEKCLPKIAENGIVDSRINYREKGMDRQWQTVPSTG
jgi:hypothetical protein